MRVLTTAINEGDHKLPDCAHKVTRYKLAPGEAMRMEPAPREVVQITPADSKAAEYLYLLAWLEGRTVVKFKLRGMVLAQPIEDDPKQRRKHGQEDEPVPAESAGVGERGGRRSTAPRESTGAGRRGRRGGNLDLYGAESGGDEVASSSVAERSERTAAPRKRKGRRPRSRPLDLL